MNASAIYLGQGAGAFLGALDRGSLGSLGWTGALCTFLSLAVLAVGTRAKRAEVAPEGYPEPPWPVVNLPGLGAELRLRARI